MESFILNRRYEIFVKKLHIAEGNEPQLMTFAEQVTTECLIILCMCYFFMHEAPNNSLGLAITWRTVNKVSVYLEELFIDSHCPKDKCPAALEQTAQKEPNMKSMVVKNWK